MKRGLGKGLSALIGETLEIDHVSPDGLSRILIKNIVANPKQPRVVFKQAELDELVESIKQNGILQPILVKPLQEGKYEIIAGERRWRAANILGIEEIPAIIKDIPEHQALEIAIIENIQRENLNAVEEALAYQRLIDEHNYTQEKISEVVSKSRSHIANLLRVLNLSDKIKSLLKDGTISLGHAKLLIGNPKSDEIVDQIINKKLNVRQTEEVISDNKKSPKPNSNKKQAKANVLKSDDLLAIEEHISEYIGLPAEITYSNGVGAITLHFEGMEEFDKIVQRLTKSIS